jgi:hypothetical protein
VIPPDRGHSHAMGVESIKDIYQYPTVRTWRRHSRTPCSMLTRGDLAKRAEVVDVESGKLPAPECSWMVALRLRRPLPRLIRTTLPKACLTWFGRNTDLCVSSRAFDQDHLECGCEYPLDLSRSQRHRTTVMPGTTTITLKCDHGEGVNARSPPKWLSNTTSSWTTALRIATPDREDQGPAQ